MKRQLQRRALVINYHARRSDNWSDLSSPNDKAHLPGPRG